MNLIEDEAVARLRREGYALPTPTETHYDYLPAVLSGKSVAVAGQIPKLSVDTLMAYGVLGVDVGGELAKEATRLCVLHALSWVHRLSGGLDSTVAQVLRVNYYFQVAPEPYREMSTIADAGSQLLAIALGTRGRHARSVIGVKELPRNSPVLIDMDVALF